MSFTVGARLGPYEIVSAIGAGGMGEVYRGRDTRLKRDVALKILPESFVNDPDRLARFQREAEVLASLNHPNIGAIYGLEESDGPRALVMELVEGDTLADRIAQGPIPLDEALRTAKQIAEALEAAHERGIIHRDLKPANIKITPDGRVKVLDFGLAKALEPVTPMARDATLSPTITSPAMLTGVGVLLGTAAYMSPEQARGKTVDKRTDVWAFGAVLYEMLTGRHAFGGDEVTDVFARIIEREPDFGALPPATPASIRRLLRRCLQKDRQRRLADASDVRLEIEDALNPEVATESTLASTNRARGHRERLAWGSALTVAILIAAAFAFWTLRPVPPAPELHLEVATPPTTDPTSLAISPDGTSLVFAGTVGGQSRLWLRSLSSGSTRTLAGTEGAQYVFWSADSRSIGFLAENRLKRIDIDSGSIQILASAPGMRGGAWNRDGVVLFSRTTGSPIFRISATGAEATPVTRLEPPQQNSHRFPQFLPDGRHFLYYVQGTPEARGVYVGQLDGLETRRLLDADAAAVYAFGQLLFVRQETLFGQAFDPVRLMLVGDPIPIAEHMAVDAVNNLAALSASTSGCVVYRTGGGGGQRQFVWFDRAGKELEKIGSSDSAGPAGPSMSPDGRRVAFLRTIAGNTDIWVLDLGRGVLSRFTSDITYDNFPIWSPDATRIVFSSNRGRAEGGFDLYEKTAVGLGNEKRLVTTDEAKAATDWSSDGRFLLYRSLSPKTSYDIWALPMVGDRKPFPVVQTNFEERDAQFSPDGKWIAYQSNESGPVEIYIRPFPGPGPQTQISTTGGAQVRWRRDGKELFYVASDARLMAVSIGLPPDTQAVEVGRPIALFETRIGGAVAGGTGVIVGSDKQEYVVSPDGQRFLMNTFTDEASTSPITVLLNWTAALKK